MDISNNGEDDDGDGSCDDDDDDDDGGDDDDELSDTVIPGNISVAHPLHNRLLLAF